MSNVERLLCLNATGSLWPGAGAPSANFVARERSLKVHILAGWFRESDSESWRARIGHEQPVMDTVRTTGSGQIAAIANAPEI